MTSRELCRGSDRGLVNKLGLVLHEIVPEDGLSLLILDTLGRCWSSEPDHIQWIQDNQALVTDLMHRIDDGDEPVTVCSCEACVVAAQLKTPHFNYGYVFLVLPKRSSDTTLQNWDLIELVLQQVNLIAMRDEHRQGVCV